MARICNDETGCFGVQGGHGGKTLRLSAGRRRAREQVEGQAQARLRARERHRVVPVPGREDDQHARLWRDAEGCQGRIENEQRVGRAKAQLPGVALAEMDLALLDRRQGGYTDALAGLERALAVYRQLADNDGEITVTLRRPPAE